MCEDHKGLDSFSDISFKRRARSSFAAEECLFLFEPASLFHVMPARFTKSSSCRCCGLDRNVLYLMHSLTCLENWASMRSYAGVGVCASQTSAEDIASQKPASFDVIV